MALEPFMHSAPHPCTTAVGVAKFEDGSNDMVVMFIESPEGSKRHFMSAAHARQFAGELVRNCDELEHHGLTIAKGIPDGLVDPGKAQHGNGAQAFPTA